MPRRWLDVLSKLVGIRISGCSNFRVLPRMSKLPHLKKLVLEILDSLEYIEDEDDIQMGGGGEKRGNGAHNDYFPSLEDLQLLNLMSLKGWTRPSKDDDDGGEPRQLLFPRLLHLHLHICPKLMSMPPAPKLESLEARGINWKWLVSYCEEASSLKKLNISEIDDVGFQSISNSLSNLQNLVIDRSDNLTSLVFEPSNSIRHLEIIKCKRLKNVSLGNLSVLDTMIIKGNIYSPYDEFEEEIFQSIACLTTLQKLEIGC